MQDDEFVTLTPDVLADLVEQRRPRYPTPAPLGKRREPRWPFPGTVELWIPDGRGNERHLLATAMNISVNGIGLQCEENIPVGLSLPIAVHLPKATYLARAVVRHVAPAPLGYNVGMEFAFPDS